MVALPNQPHHLTEEEYFKLSDESEFKIEYVNGEIIMMAGASVNHGRIKNSISRVLGNQLLDGDCDVIDDVRLAVLSVAVSYRFPDLMVLCGEANTVKNRTDTIDNPIVLVEILSPSTKSTDKDEKLKEYTRLESVQEYVLVSQTAPQIEIFRRQESGLWTYTTPIEGLDNEITLHSIDCVLKLSDVYRRVTFGDDEQL